MKDKIQGFVIGAVSASLLISGGVYAYSGNKTISAEYDNIKVYIDNVMADLKDTNGKTVEPFISDGTTYLPVRGIAQASGMQVEWDGISNIVYLWNKLSPGNSYMVDPIEPYDNSFNFHIYKASEGNSFKMAGELYSNGYNINPYYKSWGTFNLNGKYDSLTFTYGPVNGYFEGESASLNFIVDGKPVKTITCQGEDLPASATVPLNHGLQLKIVGDGDFWMGMADVILN